MGEAPRSKSFKDRVCAVGYTDAGRSRMIRPMLADHMTVKGKARCHDDVLGIKRTTVTGGFDFYDSCISVPLELKDAPWTVAQVNASTVLIEKLCGFWLVT